MIAGAVLPDTSVWIEYLRLGDRGRAGHLGDSLRERRVRICGPVVAELLAGSRPPDQALLGSLLGGLTWVDLDRSTWRQVGLAAGELRRIGQSVPLTDIEIAVAACRAGATLWTAATDFERLRLAVPELRVTLLG